MPKPHVVTIHSVQQQPLPVSRTDQIKFYFKAGALLLATTAMYAAARATRLLPQWQSSDSSPALPNAAPEITELSNDQEQITQLTLSLSEGEDTKKENSVDLLALSEFKSGLTDFHEIPLDTSHTSETNTHKRKLLQTSNGSIVVANPIPDQTAQVGNTYTYDLGEVFSGDYTLLGALETGKNSLPSWLNLEYKKLGSYHSPSAYGIAISGDTAFVVNYDSSLYILNVSDLTNPKLLSTYQAGVGGTRGIAASENTVFIANQLAGLHIVDVSNSTNPQLLSTYPIIGDGSGQTWGGVAVSGNTVFVANYNGGLQILDVSNRTNPNLLSIYPSTYAWGVTVSGNTVFLAAYVTGLQILDVSNPRNPQLLGTYPPGAGQALSVSVSGNTAFVAINAQGLQILDISNLAAPKLLSTYPINGIALYNVVSLGNTIFIGGANLDAQILDISDPSSPKLLGIGKSNSGYVFNIALSENIAYMADHSAGLQILDVTRGRLIGTPGVGETGQRFSITAMVRNETAEWITDTFSLTLNNPPRLAQNALTDQSVFPNQSLILSLDSEQLFINPSASFLRLTVRPVNGKPIPGWLTLRLAPNLLSTYPANSGGQSYGITVAGNTAYVSNYFGGLQIIDVSDLTMPRLLSTYPSSPGGNAWNTAVLGNTLFMADHFGGLHILDISVLTAPQLLSTYPAGSGYVLDVSISGNIVFLATHNTGLKILNVSNLMSPQLLSTYSAGSGFAYGLAVSGNTVFVANYNAGLQILNISAPTNPKLLSTYKTAGVAINVAVSGNMLFVADASNLQILDVTNLSNPQLLSTYPAGSGSTFGVTVSGNIVFVADYSGGLQILDVSNLTNPRLLGTYLAGNGNGLAFDVTVSGNTVFVADGSAGLQILDLSTWELAISPITEDVGNYPISLTATDIAGGSVSKTFTIRVEGPPQLHNPLSSQYAKVGQVFYYITPLGTFTDPNFDPLLFSVSTLPAWLNFDSVSAAFTGTPSTTDVGVFTIQLIATDPLGGTARGSFNLTVTQAPQVANTLPPLTLIEGTHFNYSIPNNTFNGYGQQFTYNLLNGDGSELPAEFQFVPENLTFSGTPQDAGIFNLLLTAQTSSGDSLLTPLGILTHARLPTLATQYAKVSQPFNYYAAVSDELSNPRFNPLIFGAHFTDRTGLPGWLTFNPLTLTFVGTPSVSDLGNIPIRLIATDSLGNSGYTDFNITVVYAPVVNAPLTQAVNLVQNRYFTFSIPTSTFYSYGETLTYAIKNSDGSGLLPVWMHFISENATLFGLPTGTGVITLFVTAQDAANNQASTPISLVINANAPPKLEQPISTQTAQVGQPFKFFVPANTFTDPNGDALTYSASLLGGSPLPTWLTFDPKTVSFKGTPGRSDTDFYAVHVQTIVLTAADIDHATTNAVFNLNVGGTSNGELFVKIASPVVSIATFAFTFYKKRSLCFNRYKPQRYGRLENTATVGEAYTYKLETPPEKVALVQAKLPAGKRNCCAKFFKSPRVNLPGGQLLPPWLTYDPNTNSLYSEKGPRETDIVNNLIIQVKDHADVIREQFVLRVVPQNALDDPHVEAERKDDIPLQVMR